MLGRVKKIWQSSPFLRHVMTLMTGTAGAQVVVMLMMMVITRIFTREQLGELGVYNSIVAAIVAVAAGRYDLAVMLEKDDTTAKNLVRLAFRLIVVISITASLLAFLLGNMIAHYYSVNVAWWLRFIGVTIFFLAGATLIQFWFNRASDYKTIALNRVQQQIGATSGQVAFGVAGVASLGGLIFGQTIGQAFAFFNLSIRACDLRRLDSSKAPSMRQLARKHWRMPVLNGPNVLVDALRGMGIPLLIGAASLSSLAEYRIAEAAMTAPVALFTGAISQVFFQKLSQVDPGRMYTEVRGAAFKAMLVGIMPFSVLYVIAPWLLPIVFGSQYAESGYYAQALIPWLFMTLITSPISNMFVVTKTQGWLLGFAVLYTVLPLSWLYFSPYDLLPTIRVLGIIMGACLCLMVLMALFAARCFDRDGGK